MGDVPGGEPDDEEPTAGGEHVEDPPAHRTADRIDDQVGSASTGDGEDSLGQVADTVPADHPGRAEAPGQPFAPIGPGDRHHLRPGYDP